MSELEVEPDGSQDFGPCECCGDRSRRVWGFVHRGDATEAAYGVHWTLGKVAEHGAHVDLILGRWGEGAERADRYAVSLEFRPGAGVMVIDASERDIARSELVSRALRREEVIGTPLAQRVFDLIDAIWLQDGRIAEVSGLAP
jgi:hypothetical protein